MPLLGWARRWLAILCGWLWLVEVWGGRCRIANMNLMPDADPFTPLVDDLANQGWSQRRLFASESLTRELAAECRRRAQSGQLNAAGIGRGSGQQLQETVRGDSIQWLESGQCAAGDQYLALLDDLRQALNRSLFLGLEDFEGHFAVYPPGAFYLCHLDRFRDDDRRTVSVVFYLNEAWQVEEGGALRLHLPDEQQLDILPEAGTLAVFMSADTPHEVLPTTRERLSLTGWFRRRGDSAF